MLESIQIIMMVSRDQRDPGKEVLRTDLGNPTFHAIYGNELLWYKVDNASPYRVEIRVTRIKQEGE